MRLLAPEEGLRVLVSASTYAGDGGAAVPVWVAEAVVGDGPAVASVDFVQVLAAGDDPREGVREVWGPSAAEAVGKVMGGVGVGECVAIAISCRPRHEPFLRYAAAEALRVLRSPAMHVAECAGGGVLGSVVEPASGEGRRAMVGGLSLPPVERNGLRLVHTG